MAKKKEIVKEVTDVNEEIQTTVSTESIENIVAEGVIENEYKNE